MSDIEITELKQQLKEKLKERRKRLGVERSSKYIKESQKTCEICGITTNKYNFEKHLLTKRHLKNLNI